MAKVYAHVERTHSLPTGILSAHRRDVQAVVPRTAVWKAIRDHGASSVMIGYAALRNHTTILAGVKSAGIHAHPLFPAYYETADAKVKAEVEAQWGKEALELGLYQYSVTVRKDATKESALREKLAKLQYTMAKHRHILEQLEDKEQDLRIAINELKKG